MVSSTSSEGLYSGGGDRRNTLLREISIVTLILTGLRLGSVSNANIRLKV